MKDECEENYEPWDNATAVSSAAQNYPGTGTWGEIFHPQNQLVFNMMIVQFQSLNGP